MAFEVLVTDEAFADLDGITGFIKENGGVEPARKWLAGMLAAIGALAEMPGRCPIAAESSELGEAIHVLLHGRGNRAYKIYFVIHHETATVRVLHIRHWARRKLTAEELGGLSGE
jgi:plasmid stabilization system protein ParE